jgi:hypothetical protein
MFTQKQDPGLTPSVTRLVVFSPNGWSFPLGSYLKITEVAQILGYFIQRLSLCITYVLMTKNGLGYIFYSFSQTHLLIPQTGRLFLKALK